MCICIRIAVALTASAMKVGRQVVGSIKRHSFIVGGEATLHRGYSFVFLCGAGVDETFPALLGGVIPTLGSLGGGGGCLMIGCKGVPVGVGVLIVMSG